MLAPVLCFTTMTSKITERLRRQRPHKPSERNQFTTAEAAKMAGITEALLALWLATDQFVPSTEVPALGLPDPSHPLHKILSQYPKSFEKAFLFTQADIARLRKMIEQTPKPVWIDDGRPILTVAQVAAIWQLSDDTVRRIFEDEPDVLRVGDAHPRGKRPRVTVRIPRKVMERVERKLSNKIVRDFVRSARVKGG